MCAVLTKSYRGLGSGITRALKDWPNITFLDDREGSMFTATVRRTLPTIAGGDGTVEKTTQKSSLKSSLKSSQKILALIGENCEISSRELAAHLGITERAVKKQIAILKSTGQLRRIGPDKGGHWEVVNP